MLTTMSLQLALLLQGGGGFGGGATGGPPAPPSVGYSQAPPPAPVGYDQQQGMGAPPTMPQNTAGMPL